MKKLTRLFFAALALVLALSLFGCAAAPAEPSPTVEPTPEPTPTPVPEVNVPVQDIADQLVRCGVRAIWNFAPVDLTLPEGVAVNNVHLSDSLHILSYRMNEKELFAAIDAAKKS